MKRIDDRTVEFTDAELVAMDRFDTLLGQGLTTPVAARIALMQFVRANGGIARHHTEFIRYMSEGTCRPAGSRVQLSRFGKRLTQVEDN